MRAFFLGLLGLAIVPMAEGQPRTRTVLAVFAHADDESSIGPLLARYARQGARAYLAIVTDGREGAFPHSGIPAGPELVRVRAEEARCSCKQLGIEPPILLGFADGRLGQFVTPPWLYLARVESEVRRLLVELKPDIVITWGPEGDYGHADHRLVGAVVTQVVQGGPADGPRHLLYPGIPKNQLPPGPGFVPYSATDPRYLTVRIAYSESDFAAFRKSVACYKSQFAPEDMDLFVDEQRGMWRGSIYLRPWFGAQKADDIFKLKRP